MQRYFIAEEKMDQDSCVLEGQDVHHILHVMRLGPGDKIICSNSNGRTVIAELDQVSKEKVVCRIVEEVKTSRELPVQVTIAQGLPKGDKLEWVLQKGTELGAHRFIPFSSSRTIVKYDRKKEEKKRERWQKIVKEAAEQAHRDYLPSVEPVITWTELFELQADSKLVAYEGHSLSEEFPSSFVQVLETLSKCKGNHLLIVIGPEGGFAEQEITQLVDNGFKPISLGKRILRTETAALYVLAALSFYYEQIGGLREWQQ